MLSYRQLTGSWFCAAAVSTATLVSTSGKIWWTFWAGFCLIWSRICCTRWCLCAASTLGGWLCMVTLWTIIYWGSSTLKAFVWSRPLQLLFEHLKNLWQKWMIHLNNFSDVNSLKDAGIKFLICGARKNILSVPLYTYLTLEILNCESWLWFCCYRNWNISGKYFWRKTFKNCTYQL